MQLLRVSRRPAASRRRAGASQAPPGSECEPKHRKKATGRGGNYAETGGSIRSLNMAGGFFVYPGLPTFLGMFTSIDAEANGVAFRA